MNNRLLFLISLCLFTFSSFISRAQGVAPYFDGGASQTLRVCESSAARSIDSLLAAVDSDALDTLTWSVVAGPAHGTLAASYTTPSTGGLVVPSGLTYRPTGGYSGMDTLSVQVTDGIFFDTIMVYVTVTALPSAGTISGPSSVCVSSTITLTSSVSGGAWSSSNATANITSGGVVTGLMAGIDTITYFVVNGCGVAYATKIITINPLPSAGTISGPSTVCISSTISVSSSVSGGSWSLTNAHATLSGTTITGVTAGLDTLRYIFTNSCGSDTSTRVITISPVAVAGTLTGPTTVCEGASITDTASVTGGSWSATNSNATVTSAGVIAGVTAGTDTILYIVTNACSADTARRVITINPLPATGTITGAASVCIGDSITLSASLAGGIWSVTNSRASLRDSVVTGVASGADTVRYSFTNACGTRSVSRVVTVIGTPHAGPITGPAGVCRGSSITLAAPDSGAWSAFNSTATVSGTTVTGVAYGRDTIRNIAVNGCGRDTAYKIIRVDTMAPHVSAIMGVSVVCERDSVILTDSVSGGNWSMTNAHATINSSGRVRGVSAGLDTAVYILRNGCGADTAIFGLVVNPLPHAGVITGFDSVCKGGSVITLRDTTRGGMWFSDNPLFASVDTTGRVTGGFPGAANIMYIVSNSCGSDTAVHPVRVNDRALPIIGSPVLCQGAFSALIDPLPGGTWSTSIAGLFVVGPCIGGAIIGITVGTATVTYTVRNACGTSTATFDVTVVVCDSTAGVAETSSDITRSITVMPNPGTGHFSVSLPFNSGTAAHIAVTNVLGEVVKEVSMAGNKTSELDLDVPPGVYVLTATLSNERYVTRIVVTE